MAEVPSDRTTLRGAASWYDACASCAAAGPALRRELGTNWRGRIVAVNADGHAVRVRLSDFCRCIVGGSERVIDLSRAAFARLANPAVGLLEVRVSW